MATHTAMAQGSNASMRSSLEQHLGIIHFVSTKEHGWSGQSRTRYTDFQVHEITKDGEVVCLNDFHNNAREMARAASQSSAAPSSTQTPPQPDEPKSIAGEDNMAVKSQEHAPGEEPSTRDGEPSKDGITESDKAALVDLVGQTATDELIAFYTKIQQNPKASPKSQGDVNIPTIGDKSQRSRVHGEIRRIFGGKIETTTSSDDSIKATAARGGNNRQRGNRPTNSGARNGHQNPAHGSGGPYLHFSLYKENKDTMDALNHMARTLRIHPKAFGAAGTKDRRAVTVQRVSIKGRNPASLVSVNERINNIKIGDFKYAQDPIRLNDHDGNEFVIVLKNCSFSGTENLSFEDKLSVAKSTIDSALTQVIQHGFINYYGTQRFGTHQIGTQEVGMKLLKEDFAGATQALLSYDPLLLRDLHQGQDHARGANRDDVNRARACSVFLDTKNSKAALDCLPPRCHVEKTLIQHLGRNPSDFLGALMSINRSMRTMYGHAYQSLVWNFVASKRWERFGAQVIKGDLVLVKSQSSPTQTTDDGDMVMVWEEDIAESKSSDLIAHVVTESDIQDGKYSIYDVVLPSPGWDVTYPPNVIGEFYAEFMGKPENGGLDPYNMRRRQRDFSLPGSYRKLMGKLKRIPTASVQAYSNDLEQLVPTDLDIIRSRKDKEAAESDARQRNAASSWQTFTQNVHQNELKDSKARVARREAEDPLPSVRMNDTWVQTSLDGGNKRIKIAKHTDVTANEAESNSMTGGDAMQVEDSTQGAETEEINVTTAVANQTAEIKGTQEEQQAHKTLSSSIITAVTTQPVHHESQPKPNVASPQPASTNGEVTTTVDANCPAPQTTHTANFHQLDANTDPNKSSAEPQLLSVANDLQSGPTPVAATSDVATDQFNIRKTEAAFPADSADSKKIAVILRFALDTSQYATIVIRELQGVPSANNNLVQALDSPTSPSERVADSA
ncbi:pseudouridine synthase [Xylariaceae sp. AK1471]|nr:pseudouridine synthase [Xylariaceae sp. AK1471]